MAWNYVAESLEASGVRVVFGLPGDGEDLFAAVARRNGVRIVTARDQRVAGFMAWGYSLVSGQPAVCAVGGGPGLTNLLTPLLEACSSASPIVVLVAASPITWRARGGFQGADHIDMARSVTKWRFQVTDAVQVPWALRRAFHMAVNGVPGPVMLEIPNGIGEPRAAPARTLLTAPLRHQADPSDIDRVAAVCSNAKRPAFIVGGGAREAGEEIARLAKYLSAAVFVTASGRGAIDESLPLMMGVVGIYMLDEARQVLTEADVVIAWGSRLEETATLSWTLPREETAIIQVDTSPESIGVAYPQALGVLGDCRLVARQLFEAVRHVPQHKRESWMQRVTEARQKMEAWVHQYRDTAHSGEIAAGLVAPAVVNVFGSNSVIAFENGLLDMWGYHFPLCVLPHGCRAIAPAEQTAMGCGAAAALGAAVATDSPVACIVGDGAFHFILTDLATAVVERLGVTFVVLDNGGYGWVRYRQSQMRIKPTGCIFDASYLERMATAAGCQVWTATSMVTLESVLQQAKAYNAVGVPAVIRVPLRWDQIAPGVGSAYGPVGGV